MAGDFFQLVSPLLDCSFWVHARMGGLMDGQIGVFRFLKGGGGEVWSKQAAIEVAM